MIRVENDSSRKRRKAVIKAEKSIYETGKRGLHAPLLRDIL